MEEEMSARHRKEKKELQAKVQQIKKTNNNKKSKKELATEISKLEDELKKRHAKELEELEGTSTEDWLEAMTNGIDDVEVTEDKAEEEEEAEEEEVAGKANQGKVSKAEKRRQKKAQANRDREARLKEDGDTLKFSARMIESEKMRKILQERNMKMHEIQPDGNCMYAAIAHQMGGETTVASLRSQAGQFLRTNAAEFSPFITDPKTGEMLTPEQFEEYCSQTEHTPAWGGQPELRALSLVMKRKIEVLQAEGAPIIFGEECKDNTILLAYYRHYYGLGEHYNSVAKFIPKAEEEEEGKE